MAVDVYRFRIAPDVSLSEAEMSLLLATFAVEGLFGRARVLTEFAYELHPDQRTLVVDGTTEVGSAVVQVFAGLLLREFGEDAFRVERLNPRSPTPPTMAAA
jgi:hypothetical protein